MTERTLPTATDVTEKSSYAYALHRMGEELRDVPDFTDVWICIQPGLHEPGDGNRARVDVVAQALFGKDGADHVRKDGTLVHDADGLFGPVRISITAVVREAENGAEYGRAVDNGDASAEVPNGVEGGPVTGRATVPTLCEAMLGFGMQCNLPIYWNPPASAWWHQSTEKLSHTATGPSVPPEGGE